MTQIVVLTWQKVRDLVKLADDMIHNAQYQSEEDYYKAVLEQFAGASDRPGRKEKMAERYAAVLSAAEQAVGQKMIHGSRDAASVTIRRFISYFLRSDGWTLEAIGGCLGLNHSTVSHYIRVMDDCLSQPVFYADEIRMYVRFVELLRNEK